MIVSFKPENYPICALSGYIKCSLLEFTVALMMHQHACPAQFSPASLAAHSLLVRWLFLRLLALVYLAAFASLSIQINGLVGHDGILPLSSLLAVIKQHYPVSYGWQYPCLFWINASDNALLGACYLGMMAALLVLFNYFSRPALLLCFVLYLSLSLAGQDFTAFQWDSLLLESGFLAIFLTWGSGLIIFLYRFLIARFMFMGGVVKLASGDPTWANLSALSFHYQTQPLPSPLAYYAYFLPSEFHRVCVLGVFFIELIVPLLIFTTRRLRLFAAWSFIALQSSIMLTGNYAFFNLLTVLLCLFLFEDRDIQRFFPRRLADNLRKRYTAPGKLASLSAGLWTFLVLLVCGSQIVFFQTGQQAPAPLAALVKFSRRNSLVNNYGPFAVMTTTRPEIIIAGSRDGRHWRQYAFNYKPGDLFRPLGWNIPHQPRLDWQMWFAALGSPLQNRWFGQFMRKIQSGSPSVLGLLAKNPFPGQPPKYLRALLYQYHYATPTLRAATGQIWQRQFLRQYWPVYAPALSEANILHSNSTPN